MAFSELAEFAEKHHVQCTVVGPEQPLSAVVSLTISRLKNLPIFGPNKQAAQLESSKTFAKQMMKNSGVPTASYQEFTDLKSALTY